jgi:Fic family protein
MSCSSREFDEEASRAIIRGKSDYYRLSLAVTTVEEWVPWLLFMLNAVTTTARWTTEKIRAIRTLVETTAAHVRKRASSLYSRELVELVFVQPYCRIGNIVDAGIAQRQTASEYLKELCAIGVLQERKAGREKLFINPRLLRLLTTGTQP